MLKSIVDISFSDCPISDYPIDYFAFPRINHNGFKYDLAKKLFRNREQWGNGMTQFGFAPPDGSIFKRRIQYLSHNNEAYSLLNKANPSIRDLERASELDPCWSNIIPIKVYLIHHPKIAREYRGMVPFGSEVTRYYNSIPWNPNKVSGSPTYTDHVNLRNITNNLADHLGWSTVTINNAMHIEGGALTTQHVTIQSPDEIE
jgi:hypothetical protein